jgi:cytochrome oxidase assembly protein ShyY1
VGIRRFLSVRWVAIHLLTVAIVIIFALFGVWQLHRWEHRGTSTRPPDVRPAVALSELVSPDQPLPGGSIGRRTTVTGRYDGANQVLVADRELDGRQGFWVVTPVRPDGSPAALVVRGWVPSPDDPALRVPAGPVTVTGRVYASEDLPPIGSGPTTALPPGQFRQVNTAELTGRFPYRILDGYLLLAAEQPPSTPAPAVVPVPLNQVDNGGGLRNLAYSLQWWMFALAVLYFWSRLVRDDLRPAADRVHEPSHPVPPARSSDAAPVLEASAPGAANEPDGHEDPDGEDAQLAAYNRYLADLHARSGRRS